MSAPLITDLREGLAAAMAEPDATDGLSMSCLREILAEISRARSIHGLSVEHGTDSDRARILLCEAVEASQAVDAIADAEAYRVANLDMTTAEVLINRDGRAKLRAALRAEVVQTVAVGMRWLMATKGEK